MSRPDLPVSAESADGAAERPSKSALKRAMTALQDVGRALVELPRDALLRVPLPEELAQAVGEARNIRDHEGKRRQLQYIGKLMRQVELAPIEAALADIRGESASATARLHQIEAWRERLIADDAALEAFASKYIGDAADIGALRTTIRLARREREEAKPPKHQRVLFQRLRQHIASGDE